MPRMFSGAALGGTFLLALAACQPHPAGSSQSAGQASVASESGPPPAITHGVTLGDLAADRVVLWTRADRPAQMHVRLIAGDAVHEKSAPLTAEHDFAGAVTVDGLAPDTVYQYAVWLTAEPVKGAAGDGPGALPANAHRGVARTAPAADQARPVRLAWGGDLAGQNVCRDHQRGFAIFEHLAPEDLDLFIALGDMIYADNPCLDKGNYGNPQVPGLAPATDIEGFWAHWKYARDDPRYRAFLAAVPTVPVWDDHEVVNDAGPLHDQRSVAPYRAEQHLMPLGLRAFLDYNPMLRPKLGSTLRSSGTEMYRSLRVGKHAQIFILDTRQYRQANTEADTGAQPKSMLGAAQRDWLMRELAASDATWKIVVSSVPMAIPTGTEHGGARDGWANFDQDTGFERELLGILRHMQQAGVTRSIWLTTDVHFATGFRHQPFADAPDFEVYEWVSGPLNAGVYPSRDVDASLNPERLFFHGPESADDITSYQQALTWFNVGRIDIDERGALTVRIVNGLGETVYQTALQPARAGNSRRTGGATSSILTRHDPR